MYLYKHNEIGRWRKAGQIHRWFVENVQEGRDDCGDYWVSREQLQELLERVKAVLEDNSKALELLPPKRFFLGFTLTGCEYYQQLEDTKEMLEKVLAEAKEGEDYHYRSSW